MRSKPELILPAGDFKKAQFAFLYGADCCYGGLGKYSLRKAEVNFTHQSLAKAIKLAHLLAKKFYVTFNIFARNFNFQTIKEDIRKISKAKPDAFIVADPGIVRLIKEASKVPIHLSTQANTLNWQAVKFWKDLGVKRIILARELTLKEIKEIKKKVPDIELEIFVHGAMCISYSGRCLLSAFFTGREANQGDCAQPCRWRYKAYLEEELRPGEFLTAKEDSKGTYIFNSKDLRLLEYIPDVIKAGVTGLKVEGRNKSEYYLSVIARAYRKAIDYYQNNNFKKFLPELLEETEKIAHRDYTTGFLFGKAKKGEIYPNRRPIEKYKFLGIIESQFKEFSKIICRNQIKKGDILEILTPGRIYHDKVLEILNKDGEEIEVGNPLPQKEYIFIKFKKMYPQNSILRKINFIKERRNYGPARVKSKS